MPPIGNSESAVVRFPPAGWNLESGIWNSANRRSALLAVLALTALGACRRSAGADVLELWAMGREGEVVAQMTGEFERRNPGVRVEVQQVPWSAAHEKLLTAFVGGSMPDVFQVGNTWLPELAAIGALEPLDRFVAASPVVRLDDYFAGIVDANTIDGTLYGAPWYVDTRLLFYRADLLRRAGHARPPRTWDEWVEAMTAVAARAGGGGAAILVPAREWEMPVILALQLGAGLLRDGDRYGDFRGPGFRRAFDFYLGLFRRGLAVGVGDTQATNVYQDFADGYFSFYVTGPWNLGEFARRLPAALQDDWSTAPLPGPDGRYPGPSLAGGASLAIFRGSPRKASAWKLIEHLSREAAQVEFHRLSGDLPARESAWDDPALAGDARARAFRTQLNSVRATPKIPEWERIAAKIGHYAELAIRERMSAGEALAALDADVDAILEKRRWLLRRVRRDPDPAAARLEP